ncbi:MAG: CHASE2 domain-containing protein [Janthinobacterium lividum]
MTRIRPRRYQLRAMTWVGRLHRLAIQRLPWFLLSLGLITLVSTLTLLRMMPRMDRLLQDATRSEFRQPQSNDPVIVAIDDKSLAQLGDWPWRRTSLAEVLQRIATDSPRCIGLNLPLHEPDRENTGDDAALAESIAHAGCVVLPVTLQSDANATAMPPVELLPIPVLTRAAAGIGHSRLAVDEDGMVRSVYLREGFAGRSWPHISLAMQLAASRDGSPAMPPAADAASPVPSKPGSWLRADHELIVFTTGTPPFPTVSYVDVLQGRAPPGFFRDRYVLVGATAAGLGDVYHTLEPRAAGLKSGVEISSSIFQGLRYERRIVIATPWQDLVYNLVPLCIALLGLLWLRPLGVVALIVALVALQMGTHNARPWLGIQFAPAAGFLGLLLVFPLWSLMRLSAAVRYLRWGTKQLNEAMDGLPAAPPRRPIGDFLDRQMSASAEAGLRMHNLQRFVRDGIDHMADATLVLNRYGLVLIANQEAARRWRVEPQRLVGSDVHELLSDLRWRTTGAHMVPPGALRARERDPILGEGEDGEGRIVLLRCVPFFDNANRHAGWMTALIDITPMRDAQSQRDEALRFISHDIREPSASILTAIELARSRPDVYSGTALLDHIERHARTGLDLADDFVNLARAEAQPFHAEVLDLVALMQQSIDDAWAPARKHQLRVQLVTEFEEALCVADRSLLTRALTNVLSNAIKYAPRASAVTCTVAASGSHWAVGVHDNGPGISAALQSQLFQPFHRLHRESHPEVHGIGLGLLLVRTAVQRHGGTIVIDSDADAGCRVTLLIPQPSAAELRDLSGDDKE